MSNSLATGMYALFSIQKTLPYLNTFGSGVGTHNYIALVDPNGNIISEMQGLPTDNKFTMFGPEAGDYLRVYNFQPGQYMNNQAILAATPFAEGSLSSMQSLYNTGYNAVAAALNTNHELHDGYELSGNDPNSNSVWYTALLAMGVSNPSQFLAPGTAAPGSSIDLRTAPTNNPYIGTSKDSSWTSNPPVATTWKSSRV